jgi:type I restriction enzyme R subunit
VGSGKSHNPEKKRLSEIIDTLNNLFGSEVNDENQLHFAQGVADRMRQDDSVMAQVNSHPLNR